MSPNDEDSVNNWYTGNSGTFGISLVYDTNQLVRPVIVLPKSAL